METRLWNGWLLVAAAAAGFGGCCAPAATSPLRYVGSSTIGLFVDDARAIYKGGAVVAWTEPESYGGEQAVLHGIADVAGVARKLDPALERAGLVATLIGHDSIAVIVNPANRVENVSLAQLRGIFAGAVGDWGEVGGAAGPIHRYVVGPDSATLAIFRGAVLGKEPFGEAETVRPDADVVARVAADPNGVGIISVSFLLGRTDVRALSVDGEKPSSEAGRYAVSRPLYLVTRGAPSGAAKAFVEWAVGAEGREVVRRRFLLPAPGSVAP